MTCRGLSPRVRGNPTWTCCSMARVGSIPACAGEPTKCGCSGGRFKVYPRVCGGTQQPGCAIKPLGWVYPRVYGGTTPPQPCSEYDLRSIPAFTGEPPDDRPIKPSNWVYPRVYGGTATEPARTSCWHTPGSIPACTGEPAPGYLWDGGRCAIGSIPACAGEPLVDWGSMRIRTVYPRVCGGTRSPQIS